MFSPLGMYDIPSNYSRSGSCFEFVPAGCSALDLRKRCQQHGRPRVSATLTFVACLHGFAVCRQFNIFYYASQSFHEILDCLHGFLTPARFDRMHMSRLSPVALIVAVRCTGGISMYQLADGRQCSPVAPCNDEPCSCLSDRTHSTLPLSAFVLTISLPFVFISYIRHSNCNSLDQFL